MDIIKKELKKGKVQKFISVLVNLNKNKLDIIVKNNGFWSWRYLQSFYAK